MKKIISQILIMGSFIALTACGGGGDGDTTPSSSSLTLITAFYTTVQTNTNDLEAGISTACYSTNGNYVKETSSIVNSELNYVQSTYSDDQCVNATATSSFKASIVVDQDVTINRWKDGQGNTLTLDNEIPAKASDPSTALPLKPKYTKLNLTIKQTNFNGITIGDTTNLGFVIDNSSAEGVVLYRVDENGDATDADPYTNIPPSIGGGGGSTGGPNLVVTITSIDYTLAQQTINYTVTNTGNEATLTSTIIMGWINRTAVPDYTSASSGAFEPIPILGVGQNTTGSITVSQTFTTGEMKNAYVIVDQIQDITETDEGLTGTNDNLAHKAWTVPDRFNLQSADYIDGNQSTTITARLENGATFLILDNGLSGTARTYVQIRFLGEISTPGTYTYSGADIIAVQVVLASTTLVTHAVVASVTPFTVIISEASTVANVITGTYSGTLCESTALAQSSCNASGNFSGSFSVIRDPDV